MRGTGTIFLSPAILDSGLTRSGAGSEGRPAACAAAGSETGDAGVLDTWLLMELELLAGVLVNEGLLEGALTGALTGDGLLGAL
jgi:hypothetical protein